MKPNLHRIASFVRALFDHDAVRFLPDERPPSLVFDPPELEPGFTSGYSKARSPLVTGLYMSAAALLDALVQTRSVAWSAAYGLPGDDEMLAELFFCSELAHAPGQVFALLSNAPGCCPSPLSDPPLPASGRLMLAWSADDDFAAALEFLRHTDAVPHAVACVYATPTAVAALAALGVETHALLMPFDLAFFGRAFGRLDAAAHAEIIAATRGSTP